MGSGSEMSPASISQINLKIAPADSVVDRARAQIAVIESELDAGRPFAEVARQFSEDPGSAADGGNLGCFGPGTMIPEFERAALGLKPGERSEAILSPFGYHVILLLEITEERQLERPERMKELRDGILRGRGARLQRELLETVAKQKGVQIKTNADALLQMVSVR